MSDTERKQLYRQGSMFELLQINRPQPRTWRNILCYGIDTQPGNYPGWVWIVTVYFRSLRTALGMEFISG